MFWVKCHQNFQLEMVSFYCNRRVRGKQKETELSKNSAHIRVPNIIKKAAADFDDTENDLKPFHEGKSVLNIMFSSAFSPPPQVTLNHHFLHTLRGVSCTPT